MSAIRQIPSRFEDYLHHMRATRAPDAGQCPGCLEHPVMYSMASPFPTGEPTLICESCLRNFHGHDGAQEATATALLGGAIRAALAAEVPLELVRAVIDEAIDASVEANSHYRASVMAAVSAA